MNEEHINPETHENKPAGEGAAQTAPERHEEVVEAASGEGPADENSPENAEHILLRQVEEWKDKYMRLYADFDNFRKNKIKERAELIQTAGADVITALLPVLDDFDRAMKAAEKFEDIEAVREGFKLIQHKLENTLQSRGLKTIDALHQSFDTDLHEAITNIPAGSPELKGKVVDILEKGFTLNEKVIRYAKVVVGQ